MHLGAEVVTRGGPSGRLPGAQEASISTGTESAVEQRSEDHAAAAPPSPTPARRRLPTLLLVVLGLIAGIAGAVLVPRLLDGDEAPPAGDPAIADRPIDAPADVRAADADVPPGAGAATPEAAVTGFLDAEVAGDLATSFGFLSEEDRTTYGSPAGWEAGHADAMPPVLGYELEPVPPSEGAAASAVTMVALEPGLDQVVGLTPARARVTWDVRQGTDGAWGVSLGEGTTFEALHPSDEGAGPAAQRWVDARQRCETPPNEFGGMVGRAVLADALCGAEGELSLGEPGPLGDIDATTFTTAFGPETAEASRLVRISGAVELGAVLAPIGDEWTVIGVVP